jgi:hypothetical protein
MHRQRFLVHMALLVAALSLGLAPRATAAEGVNLAWNHCLGEGTGVQNVTFACDTNSGSNVMTGSFVLGAGFTETIGLEIVLQLASSSANLPTWWSFRNAGTCRQGSMTADLTADPLDVACEDWSLGQAAGGFASWCTIAGECSDHPTSPNVARLKVASAVAVVNKRDLVAGTEYFAFHLKLDHAETVGAGSCAGCETPVCIVLNSIMVVARDNIAARTLATPTVPGSNFITWQGGGAPVAGGLPGCPAATATHRSAWGAVKELYR